MTAATDHNTLHEPLLPSSVGGEMQMDTWTDRMRKTSDNQVSAPASARSGATQHLLDQERDEPDAADQEAGAEIEVQDDLLNNGDERKSEQVIANRMIDTGLTESSSSSLSTLHRKELAMFIPEHYSSRSVLSFLPRMLADSSIVALCLIVIVMVRSLLGYPVCSGRPLQTYDVSDELHQCAPWQRNMVIIESAFVAYVRSSRAWMHRSHLKTHLIECMMSLMFMFRAHRSHSPWQCAMCCWVNTCLDRSGYQVVWVMRSSSSTLWLYPSVVTLIETRTSQHFVCGRCTWYTALFNSRAKLVRRTSP